MIGAPNRADSASLRRIETLKPSPENDLIYGAIDTRDLDLINLANDIAANGILEPIQVSTDGFVISGHRRYAAAKLVGLEQIRLSLWTNVARPD